MKIFPLLKFSSFLGDYRTVKLRFSLSSRSQFSTSYTRGGDIGFKFLYCCCGFCLGFFIVFYGYKLFLMIYKNLYKVYSLFFCFELANLDFKYSVWGGALIVYEKNGLYSTLLISVIPKISFSLIDFLLVLLWSKLRFCWSF